MSKKAEWLEITGIDGGGKTSLKKRLVNDFFMQGKKVHTFHMPYSSFVSSSLDISGKGKPLKDNYTDQLIFALDYRLTNYRIKDWRKLFDLLISQRGITDAYVHGAVRGFTYEQINEMIRVFELEKPSVILHMNADPDIAFDRIKYDANADKFETPEYIRIQHDMTNQVYNDIMNNHPALRSLQKAKHIYIDTTKMTQEQVYKTVEPKVKKALNEKT